MNFILPPPPPLVWSCTSARMSRSATRSPATVTKMTRLAPRGRRSFKRVAPITRPGLSSEWWQSREHSVAAVTICPEAIGRELDMLLELWRRFEDFGNAPEGAAVSYRWAFHMMEWENIVSNAAFKSHGKGESVKEREKMATVWRRSIHL